MALINNLVIIRAGRGEDVDELMTRLENSAKDMSGPLYQAFITDPEANIALAKGDLTEALKQFTATFEVDSSQIPEYSYRAAVVAVLMGNLDETRRLADIYVATGGAGPIVNARRASLSAGIAALEGRQSDAIALYRDALRDWRAAGAAWDEALMGLCVVSVLDPADPEVAAIAGSTREIFERLRAQPYLDQLDALLARHTSASPRTPKAERQAVAAEPAS
jgi:tetratricopeptide (TPR) repeat protein